MVGEGLTVPVAPGVSSGTGLATAPRALVFARLRATHSSARADIDAGTVTLLCRVLDECDQATGHEAAGSNRRAATGDLRDLDDAAGRRHLDAPAGARGHDLEVLDALAGVDHCLNPIAFHPFTIACCALRVATHVPWRGHDGVTAARLSRAARR